jgi:hypothetical protein
MGNELVILQSGFGSLPFTTFQLSNDKDEKEASWKAAHRGSIEVPVGYYDQEVEDTFNAWNKRNQLTYNFEFKEKVLKLAIRLLGLYPHEWFKKQLNVGSVSYLHLRYLAETLKFVYGEKRLLNNFTAYRLLNYSAASVKQPTGIGEQKEIQIVKEIGNSYTSHISSFLHEWVGNEDGVADLICFLKTVWGARIVVRGA